MEISKKATPVAVVPEVKTAAQAAFDPVDFARKNIFFHNERELPREFRKVNYVTRKNGFWEIRDNPIGEFYTHLWKGDVGGFGKDDEVLEEGFMLHVPEIPIALLNQVVAFFKALTKKHDYEAYAQFYWNPVDEEYWVNVPEQTVDKASVKYKISTNIPKDHILVCEIHSHNSMAAFFSATDDKDEKSRGDRFFGVVGHLNKPTPDIKMSFIMGGRDRISVEVEDLFTGSNFPKAWLESVKEPPKTIVKPYKPYKANYKKGYGLQNKKSEVGNALTDKAYVANNTASKSTVVSVPAGSSWLAGVHNEGISDLEDSEGFGDFELEVEELEEYPYESVLFEDIINDDLEGGDSEDDVDLSNWIGKGLNPR